MHVAAGCVWSWCYVFFQPEDGIRVYRVTGVQTCALPISPPRPRPGARRRAAPRAPLRAGATTAVPCRAVAACDTPSRVRPLRYRSASWPTTYVQLTGGTGGGRCPGGPVGAAPHSRPPGMGVAVVRFMVRRTPPRPGRGTFGRHVASPRPVEHLLDPRGVLLGMLARGDAGRGAGVVGEPGERVGGLAVERVRRLGADDPQRLLGGHRGAVRALRGERLVNVGDREQAHRRRQLGGRQAVWIAAAVEALVVGGRGRRDRAEARDALEDPA